MSFVDLGVASSLKCFVLYLDEIGNNYVQVNIESNHLT